MNSLLIVAATSFELEGLMAKLHPQNSMNPNLRAFEYGNIKIDILITGAGMVNTAFYMGQLTGKNYDHALDAGICGSFRDEIKIGEVVYVTEDCFSDFGVQDGDSFLSISEINLGEEKVSINIPIKNSRIESLKKVRGITVNTVHGNETAIKKVISRVDPDIESMEGAAFFMACNHYNWKCAQIRAVSNKVERRDREKWNIPLAIKNLNDFLIDYLNSL